MESLKITSFKALAGTRYGTPKEVWGFRLPKHRGTPAEIARWTIFANAGLLGVSGSDLELTPVRESLGAHHVILKQTLRGRRIYRAYLTVHFSRDRHVYLIKNRAVPRYLARPMADFRKTATEAARLAIRAATRPGVAPDFDVTERAEQMWFLPEGAPGRAPLRPAYRVHLSRSPIPSPGRDRRARQDWIILVDGANGEILRKWNNAAHARGVGKIFDPNPVIALGGSRRLLGTRGRLLNPPADAYKRVPLLGLNPTGWLDGARVTTEPTGPPDKRLHRPHLDFRVDRTERGFGEVMAYFHIDRAVRHLESLGFRGRQRIFSEPVRVNADGPENDNASYSPHTKLLAFWAKLDSHVPDIEDGEIILHELGHAIQDAICPQFGQSHEAAAMGEGFSDYFAASFFERMKPPRYRTSFASWDAIQDRTHRPASLRRLDSPRTVDQFHASDDVHASGEIWSATLWDIRSALGQTVADTIIVESHFQLDGFTTFDRAARAIVDADRNVYGARHIDVLQNIFRDRCIEPVD
jgi:hypothetical protein